MRLSVTLLVLMCTMLASWLVAGSDPGEVVWLTRETGHFTIFVEKDSSAQKELDHLCELVEIHYRNEAKIYGYEGEGKAKIPYYFHESPVKIGDREVWGFTSHEGGGEIHVAYSDKMTDSSPHELRHYLHQKVNPSAPAFFNEGGCNVGVQIGGYNFHQMLKRNSPHVIPYSLADAVRQMRFPYNNAEAQTAYSFCNYLVDNYGQEGFGKFYRVVTKANYADALKDYTGKDAATLEREWAAMLKALPIAESP